MAGLKLLNVKLINRMKKLLLKISEYKLVLISVAFLVIFSVGCAKKDEKEIKIGAILPLTGQAAQYGIWIQEALELAREEINMEGGINGKKLVIIYEDDQADPKIAASAMQKLITVDKTPVVFGSWASSCVLAQAPIGERTHTVIMAEAISPKIRDAGDYIFRIQPDARFYIMKLVPFVYEKMGFRKVSIFYVNNDFGLDQAKVFETEFKKLGGDILSSESFEQGSSDCKTSLIKIKEKNPEAIFVPAYTEIATILKQAKELGMKQQFLGSVPFENPDIIKVAGASAGGVLYPHHFDQDAENEVTKKYQGNYLRKYGRKSEGFAALAYDGIKIITNILLKYETAKCIKNELYSIKDFPGVTGPITFDDHGDVIKPIIIKTVKNGRFVKYEQ